MKNILIKNNLKTILITLFLVTTVFIIFKKRFLRTNNKNTITIGILQTATHPALNQARDGFINRMKKTLNKKIKFIIQNAEGSISNAQAIAKSFHINKQINGICTIGTMATQAAANIEKEKPIFFSVVTDPKSLNLLHPKTNLCGSTDMIDVKGQIKLISSLLPNAKTVGIIFNPAEENSQVLVKKMVKELKQQNLTPIKFGLNSESEIIHTITCACKKTDVLLAPTDHIVAISIQAITNIAHKNKTPLIVSDNLLVKKGALAARGVNFKECGKQAAKIALEVFLHKKHPSTIALAEPTKNTFFINKKMFANFNLLLPNTLNDKQISFV